MHKFMTRKKFHVIWTTVLITILALFFLFPLIWMIVSSMKPESQIYSNISNFKAFLPSKNISDWGKAYAGIFQRFPIMRYILNSVFYATSVTVGSIVVNALAGYGFAKFNFTGRKLLFGLLIALLVIPGTTLLIQQFQVAKTIGILNTPLAVILPGMSSPFYIYMFRNAFAAIPDSVTEAAELDGASNLRIFWNILLPMTLPTVATVGTLSFIGSWNDYVWPLMVLTNSDQFPLQVAITNINSTNPVYMNQVMAILTISTVPLVLVYIFFQKYLTQGMGSAGNGDK
ncbi:MAG: carbohydrate ABC transporter permease [Lactobacillus crispatus]|mgnify:FL=1|jgi:fructooligosaccharide transport system permease protein|nr:carbohydrate ABC transporter permease [Lactobacillus crispatus]MCH4005301.1 carbohydrate ABC transporter permease [Lactobacillus crispatus]MCI1336116.1 carbohydrate ABC transporter permease [Lactobacillus crispatus]MCI1365661.1 carbohydrate ABC transporter permease [Lactobacillus crispatus]MCI1492870.1 carbohydrate ABC transporter permease [Lactobacillus crispatus]MCI1524850.1 carbohydrate ABC transporter permease [Lactobacillus crispatus]